MKTYLVGGAVRDTLLNYPVYDKDWVVVGATPEQMLQNGFKTVGSDFPVFLHPDTKEEYALARTERKSGKGYNGFDYYAAPDVTLEEDLSRRDLTINAMAMDSKGNLIDPYGGEKDLQNKVLRHVSSAFEEDPLRVLRVARFAARYAHLGFTVANETIDLMRNISQTDELQHLTKERIWQEMSRALGEKSPSVFFHILNRVHATQSLFPDLYPIGENAQKSPMDIYMEAYSPTERLAALIATHLNTIKSDVIETICRSLKMPNAIREVVTLTHQFLPPLMDWYSLNATEQLNLLKSLDAERRQERLQSILNVLALIQQAEKQPDRPDPTPYILEALKTIQSVDIQAIINDGFKGKAIRDELTVRQIARLRDL
jgi:tRNA nucleotidyltransferase (CCA-adding enzyme)